VHAATVDPSRPIKRAYDGVFANEDDDAVPAFRSVRSAMDRARRALLPDLPNTVDDLVIEGKWCETWDGRRLLLHQDNDWGVVVFATERHLNDLQRCSTIYIDGTFKSCPRPFAQFVTIHGKLLGRVLPFVMALMTGKTIGQYRQLLAAVKEGVRRASGHRFRPRAVVCDFEQAIFAAVQTDLPQTEIQACYFHFCQSMWRKIQELGLAGPYVRRMSLKLCLRKFMAIGYLPIALVRMNFRLHSESRLSTRRLIRQYPTLERFISYMEMNYLDGNFPPAIWNVYNRDMDTRTNNHVECKL
jgi:hypothetical protein